MGGAVSAWLAVGAGFAPTCVCFLLLSLAPQPRTGKDSPTEVTVPRVIWSTGAFLFIYVGIEVAYGGYIDAFAREWLGISVADAAQLTSLYWAALCFGRLV